MYKITFKTKKGGSGIMSSNMLDVIQKKALSQFKQKLTATIYCNDEIIGRVYEDLSQKSGFNYFISLTDEL